MQHDGLNATEPKEDENEFYYDQVDSETSESESYSSSEE
jgi:hypothetical protein